MAARRRKRSSYRPSVVRRRKQAMSRAQLTPRQLHNLLAHQRAAGAASMLRAMGVPAKAPHLNPNGGRMARKASAQQTSFPLGGNGNGHRRRGPSSTKKKVRAAARAAGRARRARVYAARSRAMARAAAASARAAGRARRRRVYASRARVQGPLMASGVFDPSSLVTKGRRARGRRRATVYGPVQSASAYKRRTRKKARRTGAKRRTAAQRAATKRMIAANRARRGGKARRPTKAKARRSSGGRTAAQRAATKRMIAANRARRGGKGRRSPSRKAQRKFLRSIRNKAELRVFTDRKRGRKVRGYLLRNPRGGRKMARHNPRRRSRRNPAGNITAMAKKTLASAIPAIGGGALMALLDAQLLAGRSTAVRVAGKMAAAVGAGMLLRKRPATAQLLMGAILGSLGSELAAKLGGGMFTTSKAQTLQQLAYLVAADPRAMSALVSASGDVNSVPSLNGMAAPMAGYGDVNLG